MAIPEYDEATFHSLYSGYSIVGPVGEINLGYHRVAYREIGAKHARGLIAALGTTSFPLTASSVVAVIGCGMGGTVEGLMAELPGIKAVGVDVSPWVQSAKDTTETDYLRQRASLAYGEAVDHPDVIAAAAVYDTGEPRATVVVLDEDINGGGAVRNRIKSALGIKNNEDITHAISDDLLTSLTDIQIADHIGAMNALALTKAHLVTPREATPGMDPRLNIKTMSEWRTFIDSTGHTDHVLIAVGVGNFPVF